MVKKIIVLVATFFAFGQSHSADFIFLETGAQTAASGHVFFAGQGDLSAHRYFPADYTLNIKRKAYTSYINTFDGLVDQFSMGYTQPLFGGLNISTNYSYSGVSDIPKFNELVVDDATNEPIQKAPSGFFSNSNHVFSVAFGKVFDNVIDVGWDYFTIPIRLPTSLQVNYQNSNLDTYSANAFTVDVSLGLQFNAGQLLVQQEAIGDLTVFTSFMNIVGSNLVWDDVTSLDQTQRTSSSEEIPRNLVVGVNLLSSMEELDLNFGIGYQYQGRYGTSNFGFMLEYQDIAELRFGLGEKFSIGAGTTYEGIGLFFSMRPHDALGKNIFIDLSYEF